MKCSGLSWLKVKKEVSCDIEIRTEEEEEEKVQSRYDGWILMVMIEGEP